MARDEYQKERAKDMIGEFVNQVMSGELTMSKNMDVAINSRIAEIDRLVSAQMNAIMHHEDFQKLEASWRGLHHLIKNSLTGTQLKIKVMSVTKGDLLKDFERALEFDQSSLFKKVYEEEYGTFGGAPFGALIGDFEFGNHPQDMALLESISQVAAAAQDAGLLSGGQQQMLAISRALMAQPELILLDEPSLGLSPKLTKEIFEIVVRINRERGTTILLVEQNANMALNASDYGYVLENGRIVMEDTCARLREKEDIKEFYLGMKETGVRGERRWKKKKTWR